MSSRPVPLADEVSAPFWQAAREGRLVVQHCRACARLQYPPEITCQRCHADRLDYRPVSGHGRVYSYAPVTRAFHPGFTDQLPYLVALVSLDEDPSVRLFTNLVRVEPAAVTVGMAVTVEFQTVRDVVLPVFRPATEGPAR
ncbi:MAG TPA: OB-fold domain-containing protein [Pseudonocardia sp.]|jgi:hypothetical protein